MTYQEAVETIPLGRYRHFKGNEYEVIAIARHSEDESPVVVYRALYGEGGIWVRPAEMWNEVVTRDGKTYKRFERVSYAFEKALIADVPAVFALTEARVHWMDKTGIRQWNVTNYLDAYPLSYYEERQGQKCLYVLRNDDQVVGAVVLLEEDDRWPDREDDAAFYIHNLVTDPDVKGIGDTILREVEKLAVGSGKSYLRLDCAVNNEFLNQYYEKHGYEIAGTCSEGLYIGNRREKKIGGRNQND